MNGFQQFQSDWAAICENEPEMIHTLKEKLSSLLIHPEDEYVKQGLALLSEFGSSSLVFVLKERNGSIEIVETFSRNAGLIECNVLEEVLAEGSDWYPLSESGLFDRMLLRSVEDTDWNKL